MALVIVGLGNPGKEYEKTRHNAGRTAIELIATHEGFEEFVFNKTAKAFVSKGAIDGENATLVLPETFVNLSGKAVSAFIKSPKAAKIFSSSMTIWICLSVPPNWCSDAEAADIRALRASCAP